MGIMEKPAEGDLTFMQQKYESSPIIVWLVNSMEPTIGKPFMFLPSAKEGF
jgi:hypothetical protein